MRRYEHSKSFDFSDCLNPSCGTATRQNPEARLSMGIDGATLAAFESALEFYGMDEEGFIRRMIDRLIHHHQFRRVRMAARFRG